DRAALSMIVEAEKRGEIRQYYQRDWFDYDAVKDNVTDKNELRQAGSVSSSHPALTPSICRTRYAPKWPSWPPASRKICNGQRASLQPAQRAC
ncbi:hypothetical protein FK513_32650, partial [Klebsiella pneumoniae]|uniref:hypothetical protein n=1 Tax=Klebsiella pneumoniae TaxID=573 RepID=UPI00210998E5